MKNLVKELEWQSYSLGSGAKSTFVEGQTYYAYFSNQKREYIATLEGEDGDTWRRKKFCTLDAAKAACQQHYEKMVLSGLTARAKVAASIGMATLAQLDLTDEALAEIIKQNS